MVSAPRMTTILPHLVPRMHAPRCEGPDVACRTISGNGIPRQANNPLLERALGMPPPILPLRRHPGLRARTADEVQPGRARERS